MGTQVDYIVVGNGIAGTVLAYTLLKYNRTVLLVNAPTKPTASGVAAGIVNPITGKKLSKTWRAEELFTKLPHFYREIEVTLGKSFFYEMPVYRLFTSMEEQNTWLARTALPEYKRFVTPSPMLYATYLHQPYGGMEIKESGYVDSTTLMKAFREWMNQQGRLIEQNLQISDLAIRDGYVTWQGITAQKILFCEGTAAQQNFYFRWLPFRPVKGEILTVRIPKVSFKHIINQHLFIMPTQEADIYRVGATYEWKDLSWEPTDTGHSELMERLTYLLQSPFDVLEHKAGLRPATADRRPFIGLHPEIAEIGIFNGLGTKGVSLAPYFANQFAEYLVRDKELDSEVHIQRYNSLYYLSK